MSEGRNNMFESANGNIITVTTATLDANNTSATVNLFKVHNSVQLKKMYIEVTVGTIINLTAAYFDAYDGTDTIVLSNGDAVLSGGVAGTFAIKGEDAGETLKVSINDQVRLIEDLDIKTCFQCFALTQKASTDTFIRLQYTTTETPINVTIKVYAEYQKVGDGYLEVA